jgi:hypothetical protein
MSMSMSMSMSMTGWEVRGGEDEGARRQAQ